MSVEIRIASNDSVSAHWKGPKGRSSLFATMAGGRCDEVNVLDFDELLTALTCARLTPFPVSGFTASRERTLERCQRENIVAEAFPADHPIRGRSLGELRRAVVYDIGDSSGGPVDGWVTWLADRKSAAVA